MQDFHKQHELLFLTHSPAEYRALSRFLAANEKHFEDSPELYVEYERLMMAILRKKQTIPKILKVFNRLLGKIKKRITEQEFQELQRAVKSFSTEECPLIVPITLINHTLTDRHYTEYQDQVFLRPDPNEVFLLNHV